MRLRTALGLAAFYAVQGASPALPALRLEARADGSLGLVAAHPLALEAGGSGAGVLGAVPAAAAPAARPACSASFSPRGVALAVKGPPWLPMTGHFDADASLCDVDFRWLRSAGINLIRLGAMMPGVMPEPPFPNGTYRVNTSYVLALRRLVADAAEHGIYTLVEFHQDRLSEYYCGEGLPLWVASEIRAAFPRDFVEEVVELVQRLRAEVPSLRELAASDDQVRETVRERLADAMFPAPLAPPYLLNSSLVRPYGMYSRQTCHSRHSSYLEFSDYQLAFATGHGYRTLYNESSLASTHFVEYWRILAQAFKGDPNVLGFELFNEPFPGSFFTEPWMMVPANADARLQALYTRIGAAVNAIDPERIIAFSPPTTEEGPLAREALATPPASVCEGLSLIFIGRLAPIAEQCGRLWDIRRWVDSASLQRTGFTAAPLAGRSILTYHYYSPPQGNIAAYLAQRQLDEQFLHVGGLLTETCCVSTDNATDRGLFEGQLYWFELGNIGWVDWEYKNQGLDSDPHRASQYGSYGALKVGTGPAMFDANGRPLLERWKEIAHPSAQRVYGEVLKNAFVYERGRFTLVFRPWMSCSRPDEAVWDAIIVWPAGWWGGLAPEEALLGPGPGPGLGPLSLRAPSIAVAPRGAATVTALRDDPFSLSAGPCAAGEICPPPLQLYGVRLLSPPLGTKITITLEAADLQHGMAPLHWVFVSLPVSACAALAALIPRWLRRRSDFAAVAQPLLLDSA